MTRCTIALLAGALLFAMPAQAQNADHRIAIRPYVADRIESFSGRPGFQSTIAFADGERIENVAVGESGQWQVTPNRRANLLFVKPASAAARITNMTVVTDRRTYLFELRIDARAAPVYLMRFAYPAEPEQAPSPETAALAVKAAEPADPALADPGRLNFAWTVKGARGLLPERVFDNGRAVYLGWPAGRALPAILSPSPDGRSEGPVNFTAQGDYLIVEGEHTRLVLRSGRDSAILETAPRPVSASAPAPAPTAAAATPLALGK
ncbi:MAG: TrbG/VirB9 family P-type conjugative transfer protein [Proteobacteria bacterium]|nr:TrbG/VirB9 family P-type conjugative transfer protein [Pseudomonadota bacterium]